MASKVRSGIAPAWLPPPGRSWLAERRRHAGLDDATRRLLLGAVMPLGIGGGLADCEGHRRSDIEHTGGYEGSGDPRRDDDRARGFRRCWVCLPKSIPG
jgi:hypothetical protein